GHYAYHIKLKMPDVKDSLVYLAHYYGKPKGLYRTDSAYFHNGIAEFKSTDSTFVGGSYMMLLSDHSTNFEILLNKGDDLSITASVSKLPEGVKIANSPENDKF